MRSSLLRTAVTALALAIASLAGAPPASAQVPTPADVIGFAPGTDFKLADYDQVVAYFGALDAASDRVVVEEIGRSTLGKPLLLAVISTEENIRNRERYRDIARRLALAEDLTDDQARALAKEGKAVVWFDGGLHATEVAHGQLMPELAWHFATDESEETRRIRESSIILVMANMNPDGLDIVSHWYRRNVGTPFETAPVPELYHPYIGHDNNRDWTAFTQVETQAVAHQLYNVWYPQIVYNHH
ncbi:MAG TPA: M14 family zinc carboxypeptidase, partial [Longimicrobiales bacterium]|nr:M14 family zinc carboxypeptidase [Longimicrobiales bacterium]